MKMLPNGGARERSTYMNKDKAIKKLVTKYKTILENTDMDICESMKGKWYFVRYDEEYNIYERFLEFETAEELIEILTGELAIDMLLTIEEDPNYLEYSRPDLAEEMDFEYDYSIEIKALSDKLDKVIQDERLSTADITKLLQLKTITNGIS